MGLKIVKKIANGHVGKGCLLDYFLLETINYLHKKDGYIAASNALAELLNSEYLEFACCRRNCNLKSSENN